MRMIKWQNGTVITPDQTKLPLQEVTLEIKTVEQMAEAIKDAASPRCTTAWRSSRLRRSHSRIPNQSQNTQPILC